MKLRLDAIRFDCGMPAVCVDPDSLLFENGAADAGCRQGCNVTPIDIRLHFEAACGRKQGGRRGGAKTTR